MTHQNPSDIPVENVNTNTVDVQIDEHTMAPQDVQADIDAGLNAESSERSAEMTMDVDVESVMAENADLKDRLLRALAETDNIRKRADKERLDAQKFAVTGFAKQLVSVSDNFGRALASMSEDDRKANPGLQSLFEGVEATERELMRAFESAGISKIEALDTPFDPNFHEVMFETDMPEKTAGTVIQVLETGYMIHDRLLRPARVGISKGGAKLQKDGANINQEI